MSAHVSLRTHRLLGIELVDAAPEQVLLAVDSLVSRCAPSNVFFANAHTLNLASSDPHVAAALARAAWVLNDGAGVALALRARDIRVEYNLNGTDFLPRLLEYAATHGWSVFLLGGRPGVAERARSALVTVTPQLNIVGTRDGFFDPRQSADVVSEIRGSGATMVLVAMGNPLQELWLDDHLTETGCRVGVGVGAFLDFAAGEVTRAPAWIRRARMEWFYRLAKEPRRMWQRYVIGNPAFLVRSIREQWRL